MVDFDLNIPTGGHWPGNVLLKTQQLTFSTVATLVYVYPTDDPWSGNMFTKSCQSDRAF